MPMSTRDGRRIQRASTHTSPRTDAQRRCTIRTDAQVADVVVTHGRAVGVRLVERIPLSLAAGPILAAGVYGSPAILVRSGIGPPEHLGTMGIDVGVELSGVGENLADHPGTELDSGSREAAPSDATLHTIATFRSASRSAEPAPDMMFWLADPASGGAFSLDPVLLRPESRGRVRLRSSDAADPPRISLPGVRASGDLERLMQGYRIGIEIANHPAVRRLATQPAPPAPRSGTELQERVLANAYSMPHVVGTCRMGPSPADGDVVDAHGNVHGVSALSVIDASVIPNAPSGFPHLITLKVAEHLSARLATA